MALRFESTLFSTPMILLNINSVVFLTLLSTIMTDEYRYNFNEVNNKLSVKRLFVRHVSHEIRTPLNCCLLGIKYLKSSILTKSSMRDAEVIEILDEVTEGCNTSLEFVNNLLMYEKIDTVELPLYLKREDLGTLCRQVHKSFAFSAREVGIELNLKIHDALKLFALPETCLVQCH
jgi:signal transduction histidine kinase